MTSTAGKAVCLKGWEVSGITEAVEKGTSGIPSLHPFHDIDPLSITLVSTIEESLTKTTEEIEMYLTEEDMDDYNRDDEKWIDRDRNAFN